MMFDKEHFDYVYSLMTMRAKFPNKYNNIVISETDKDGREIVKPFKKLKPCPITH